MNLLLIALLARPPGRTQPLDWLRPALRPRHPSRGDSRVNLTLSLLSPSVTAAKTLEDPLYSPRVEILLGAPPRAPRASRAQSGLNTGVR